jgi:hypothetical protein
MADFMFVPARPLRPAADEQGLMAADHRLDAPGFDPRAGTDAIMDAMDWLAQLRGDGDADLPPARRYAAPLPDDGYPRPPRGDGYASAAGPAPAQAGWPARLAPLRDAGYRPAGGPAQPAGTSGGCPLTSPSVEITQPAVIGNELRIPSAPCEMGGCISRYRNPQALGEADVRSRAMAAGWRTDLLGRLACSTCQQRDPQFWSAHPAALWDPKQALAHAVLMATGRPQDDTAGRAARAAAEMIPAFQSAPRRTPAPGHHRERRLHTA